MKTVMYTKPGPPEVLMIKEVKKPSPDANEVLIKVHASTVTSGDVILRSLKFPLNIVFGLAFGLGKNKVLGHELAGVVEAVGKEVDRFKKGDAVFASTGMRGGANAEYICLPEDGMVALKPVNLSFEEAAAVPVGANTALFLLQKSKIHTGQRVLIYGASGSVGTYAVQLAGYFDAEVTGVCSGKNADLVLSLGAKNVIDYTQVDFSKNGKTYDLIFDAVGKISTSICKGSLAEDGKYLSVRSSTKEKVENLIFLKKLVEAGKLKPIIDRTYLFREIVKAHRYVESGHKKGNVVVTTKKNGKGSMQRGII